MYKLFAVLGALLSISQSLAQERTPLDDVIAEIYAIPPVVVGAPDVKIEMIIPPGLFYDSMWPEIVDGRLWVGDDGGNFGFNVGQLLSFDLDGNDMQVEVPLGKVPLYIDFTIAPPDFGRLANKILILSQPSSEFEGIMENHIIYATEPNSYHGGEIVCVMPETEYGKSHLGTELIVGPEGSPFDGYIYGGTSGNKGIIKIDPDGNCTPFVKGLPGWTMALIWSEDAQHMLVSVKVAEENYTNEARGQSKVLKVDAEGNIVEEIISGGITMPNGIGIAPKEWGPYAGQLFIADSVDYQNPSPQIKNLKGDGIVHRVNENGNIVPFVEGIRNSISIVFHKNMAFISDIGGDYMSGREMADGAVFKLTYTGGE